MNRLFAEPSARPWVPAVDILETENELVLKADIPDVEMKDIDVKIENGALTLKGERKFEGEKKEGGWHRIEPGGRARPRLLLVWENFSSHEPLRRAGTLTW